MDKEFLDNLSTAISNGRTDIVRTLLTTCENGLGASNGTSISATELLKRLCNPVGTLLHLATKLDHFDIVRTLLASGADASIKNNLGETAFDLALTQGMISVYVDELLKCAAKSEINGILQLIKAGVDVNSQDSPESKNTALHWAVCFGKPEAVQVLLEIGASQNVVNGQGLTPLHQAVERRNATILKLLLSNGADPMFKSSLGKYANKTALDVAQDNEELINIFYEYVVRDSESEKSSDTDRNLDESQSEVSALNHLNDITPSLQSLSTISEPSMKNSLIYTQRISHDPPFLLTPSPLVTDSKLHLLWPQPQKIIQTNQDFFLLKPELSVHVVHNNSEISSHSILDTWQIHKEKFSALQIDCNIENIVQSNSEYSADILCCLDSQNFSRSDSYKLVISKEQIRILSSDLCGLHYALCTLQQLFVLYHEDGTMPSIFIHDWPQLQYRSVMLDFSLTARKPTKDSLKEYIKTMSWLKMNQLHCYFKCEENIDSCLPFTNKEFIELSKFSATHFVNLVPAIEVDPHEKHVNVIDGSIAALAHQMMSLFSSKTIQIGPKLSKILLQEMKISRNSKIIFDLFLLPTSTVVFLCFHGIFQDEISYLLKLLPLNCILIDYGYQMEHDYDQNVKNIIHSGLNVCVGTGTSAWGSIAGSPENAISCIHKASLAASLHGACGMIVADWQSSDLPHQPAFCFSWPGILLGLGMSWNTSVHENYLHSRVSELLNLFIYQDSSQITGDINIELGRLEMFLHLSVSQSPKDLSPFVPSPWKSTVLQRILVDVDSVLLDNFTFDAILQVIRNVKEFQLELPKANPVCFQHQEIIMELRLAMDLLLFACRMSKVLLTNGQNPDSKSCGLAAINVGVTNLSNTTRTDLANSLLLIIEQYRSVWLNRSLPNGLETSLQIFSNLLNKLIPESGYLAFC